jgi:hypothetical protein
VQPLCTNPPLQVAQVALELCLHHSRRSVLRSISIKARTSLCSTLISAAPSGVMVVFPLRR